MVRDLKRFPYLLETLETCDIHTTSLVQMCCTGYKNRHEIWVSLGKIFANTLTKYKFESQKLVTEVCDFIWCDLREKCFIPWLSWQYLPLRLRSNDLLMIAVKACMSSLCSIDIRADVLLKINKIKERNSTIIELSKIIQVIPLLQIIFQAFLQNESKHHINKRLRSNCRNILIK